MDVVWNLAASHHFLSLGAILDTELRFDKQINSKKKRQTKKDRILRQLRLLPEVKHFFSSRDVDQTIPAFLSSRQDYCTVCWN